MQSKPELEVIVPEWNAPENIKLSLRFVQAACLPAPMATKTAFAALISEIMSETISTRFAEITGL